MAMTEAFPGVWLPKHVDVAGSFVLAAGLFSMAYDIQYSGYREAAATGRYLGPSSRPH